MSYLVIRTVHTWAVAILLGGTALMSVVVCASRKSGREDWDQDTITMIRIVEWIFWSVLGIVVFSGAGNLGAFGEGLPDHNMLWGHVFLFKLGGIGILFLVSFLRLLAVIESGSVSLQGTEACWQRLRVWYGATAVVLTVVFLTAVRLAHG